MKKTVLLLFAVMAAVLANAQDVITLANGESFYATNIRFAGNKVFFTRISDNGNTRTPVELSTKDLSKIIYESGEEEYFRKEDPNAKVNYTSGNSGNVNTGGNAVNVTVTGPTFNNGGAQLQRQYGGGTRPVYERTEFLDNPRFNAYVEGVGALFMLKDGHGSFGGFNSPYFGISGSAGARINDYFYVGAGVGFYYGDGSVDYDIYSNTNTWHTTDIDASNWFLPIFFDIRGFMPITDDVSLFGEVSVGVEFNQYSSKKENYTGKKCGKTHLNLCVGAEIQHFEVSMGVMAFTGLDRYEEFYDNYSTGDHSHSVYYNFGKAYPALYLKVGYKFGD